MDKFCYNCGAELSPGDIFCVNCGTKIIDDDQKTFAVEDSCFQFDKDWNLKWPIVATNSNDPFVIILTDTEKLATEISDITKEEAIGILHGYIMKRKLQHGVDYVFLDLAIFHEDSKDISFIISLLKKISFVSKFTYLFIVGGNDVIPTMICEDILGNDKDIESDLCYARLSLDSPWSGCVESPEQWIRTGRLPTWKGESRIEFMRYFDIAGNWVPKSYVNNRFSLSAEVWKETSGNVSSSFGNENICLSPTYTCTTIQDRLNPYSELLYFNLHGASVPAAKFWYGQGDGSFPEAFSPELFCRLNIPYIVGVEACYGARYIGYRKEESSLLSAMTDKCLAFLGSSRIAYGSSIGCGTCADVMVGEFLKNVNRGLAFGEAFQMARCQLLSSAVREPEMKTLIEFSLFGDPSLQLVSTLISAKHADNISIPDIRRMVLERIDESSQMGNELLGKYLAEWHKEMLSIKPLVYKRSNGEQLFLYRKETTYAFSDILILVTNENREIIKEYSSR